MKPPDLLSRQESGWIKAARAGDETAFEWLVHRYEQRVYTLSIHLCGNPDDAQEAAQEAFLSAWQGLPSFRGDSSFATWMYRLTCNACTDLLRREKRHRAAAGPSLDDEERNLELPDPAGDPCEAAQRRETRQAVEEGLRELSADYRSVLVLREIQQLSYQEIALILKLDIGTVKSRISRGRKQLRTFLTQKGNFFPEPSSKKTEEEGCK
jgi:RNA polymerase sigma-70 factor (ECF subfamily)